MRRSTIPSSRTLDSLVELQAPKTSTPSTSSSGYGSQAVSSTNLTSEDSMSLRSISVDETPDLENRPILASVSDLKPVDEAVDKEVVESDDSVKTVMKVEETIQEKNENVPSTTAPSNPPENQVTNKEKEEKITEYDSPCEGTSIVKTKLLPGKVCIYFSAPCQINNNNDIFCLFNFRLTID